MARQKRRFGWWRSFTRRYNALLVITPLLVVPGFLLIATGLIWPVWKDVAWLAGGALLGSGFSALVATVTGSQAIHEQYAKEANLQRKQEIYGPLHSELKALRERFEEAQRGILPYPQAIKLLGDGFSQRITQGRFSLPTLECWPQFQKDYRRDSFTETAQKELVQFHQGARDYNAAMEATRLAATLILEGHLISAIQELIASESYQHWFRDNSSNGQIRQPPPAGDTPNSWYGRIAEAFSYNETPDKLGKEYARYWFNNGGVQPSATAALGWLVATRPEQAALDIQTWTRHDPYGRQWDLSWLQQIFAETGTDLQQHTDFQKAKKAEHYLLHQLNRLERELDGALRYIRDQYEGGEPLV